MSLTLIVESVQYLREAHAAGYEQRQIYAKRQRAVLAAAVKAYRLPQQEWKQQIHLETSYCCTSVADIPQNIKNAMERSGAGYMTSNCTATS